MRMLSFWSQTRERDATRQNGGLGIAAVFCVSVMFLPKSHLSTPSCGGGQCQTARPARIPSRGVRNCVRALPCKRRFQNEWLGKAQKGYPRPPCGITNASYKTLHLAQRRPVKTELEAVLSVGSGASLRWVNRTEYPFAGYQPYRKRAACALPRPQRWLTAAMPTVGTGLRHGVETQVSATSMASATSRRCRQRRSRGTLSGHQPSK